MSHTAFVETEPPAKKAIQNHETPPRAHEDLTIAEHLESMRVRGEHRPGEECFHCEGENHWVSETTLKNFIREHGGDHPSNFQFEQGRDWKQVLFGGDAPTSQPS